MAKTAQQYADEWYNEMLKDANKQKAAREQSDAQTLSQINKAIDTAADTTVSNYQKNIDTAPQKFDAYYDDNAIDEAFAREQIKNTMAETGMTNSGQNLSMQTALSLQRNKRDAEVTDQQRDYVKEMQDAIDSVRAGAEAQKQEQALNMAAERNTWWDGILSDMRTSSQAAGAEMYAADQEAAATQAQAIIDYSSELAEKREAYALNMMKNMEYTEDQAWAAAYAQYPGNGSTEELYYAAIRDGYSPNEATVYANAGGGEAGTEALEDAIAASAKSFVSGLDLNVAGWRTMWSDKVTDGKIVAEKVLNLLGDNAAYQSKSKFEQEAILETAIARCVIDTWYAPGIPNEQDVLIRLQQACESAEVDYNNALAVYNGLKTAKKATTTTTNDRETVQRQTVQNADSPAAAAGATIGNWISDWLRR